MSQADVAFLLGKWRIEDVLRHEKSNHVPNLETALAYEAIFMIPVSELFGGLYQKIEAKVTERKKTLAKKKKVRRAAGALEKHAVPQEANQSYDE